MKQNKYDVALAIFTKSASGYVTDQTKQDLLAKANASIEMAEIFMAAVAQDKERAKEMPVGLEK